MGRVTNLFHKNPSFFNRLTLTTGLLSLSFISLFWLVILVAEDQMEVISLHHWLDAEARMFERDYQIRGEAADLPNHYEFDSYWSEQPMPKWLQEYRQSGFYEHHLGPEDKHFLVRPHPSGRGLFYVVFKDNADDYLDEYESKLHVFILTLGFVLLLLTVGFGLYLVRQMAVPLRNVVSKIKLMSPEQPAFSVEARFDELRAIEQALYDSKQHIAAFFQREQEFSRFAAHEIRTPLMVLQGSAELLAQLYNEDPLAQRALARTEQACQDIALLTDTFLLLGKAHIDDSHFQQVVLVPLIHSQFALAQGAVGGAEPPQLRVLAEISLRAPPSFIKVALLNLFKNALAYGDGGVWITLENQTLTVKNRCGEANTQGFGYGLVIVERICSRLGWHLQVRRDDSSFVVKVTFTSQAAQPDTAQH